MVCCPNLSKLFGDRYRVDYEPSYFVERSRRTVDDPWLLVLLCRHGHIYPHGPNMLGAATDKRGGVSNRLAALDCVAVVQDGDDGINVVFHVRDFEKVAAVMKPRRRRQLSDEHRRRLVEAGQAALAERREGKCQKEKSML